MKSTEQARRQMVEYQIKARGIRDERTLNAMSTVPREEFVPEDLAEFAYDDTPLPIEEGQTISQPYIVALMAEALELGPEDTVLEVGAGSGYAAAVLSRMAKQVYAIERHETLAALARERLARLGYDNVELLCGDGSRGWPEKAPFDAIVVAAGAPAVPDSLLEQLKVGGRLVLPVGEELRSQELLRIHRASEKDYEREELGQVRFVPLIGTEGWAADGPPLPARKPPTQLQVPPRKRQELSKLIARHAEPFKAIDDAELDALLDRIGDARIVLLGEASHGTSEFYRMRARISQALIERKGFNLIGLEADWPDVSQVDQQIRGWQGTPMRGLAFARFPTWMWRNREMQGFIQWLAEYNKGFNSPDQRVSIHGLDLYSLYNSIGVVLDYLDKVDPEAAAVARRRYGCFSPWEKDPATYGRAALIGEMKSCENEVVATLVDLLHKHADYRGHDGEAFFDAAHNANVVQNAEKYYRYMYLGSRESWNLRDQHMFDTLQALLAQRGPNARAIVWAHNSHVGNAAATEMGASRGEHNIGQLAREQFGNEVYSIGFGTDHGTVAAASNWDDPVEFKSVRPSHEDSYERLCHETEIDSFLLPVGETAAKELRDALYDPHLERAIGVIYRPETELLSHYFQACLPLQFDEFIWFDETRAVDPLPAPPVEPGKVPETYPFGL